MITLELPSLHPAQIKIVSQARRFNVVNCGRRWGKSTLGIDRLVHPALQGKPVAWYAPTNKSLAEMWEIVKTILLPVTVRKQEDKHILSLLTGGRVDMWSLEEPNASRGRKYGEVIIDEAAHVKHMEYAWTKVIRATLTDLKGGAWFMSSPNGANFFKKLFDRGMDPVRKAWRSWQMPSYRNPYLDPAEIDEARDDLGEAAFTQEYLAQFVASEGAVFRKIQEAATAIRQLGPITGHKYAFGIDWGRRRDATVVAIIDLTIRSLVALERWVNLDYPTQKSRIVDLYRKWEPDSCTAESNSMGEAIIEDLQKEIKIKAFQTNNTSKMQIIDDLQISFEQEDLKIINDPVLLSELGMFEAFKLPSGLMRYEAPSGQHDDTVIASAIAYQALGRKKRSDKIVIGSITKPAVFHNMANR